MADIYMKIDGIDGESTDDKHEKWVELSSFNHEVVQPISGASGTGGRTASRAEFSDFSAIKTLDKTTPELNLLCANGKHIPIIEVECCLATEDKHTYMKYTMEDCVVTSVQASSDSGNIGAKPTEAITIAYGQLKWSYTPIDHTGKPGAAIEKTWSLEKNKQG